VARSNTPEVGMEICEVLDCKKSGKVGHSKPSIARSSVGKEFQKIERFMWKWFHWT